ncbi:uncharacterized protein LOC124168305 isoform X2 [Ischnura elegans]|uniref:uncharacterized protein LOC124168305 isoform X2 n=1 Tax=Ischnura elegans TaxID=197161 RepID=UPI001ED8AEA1|nr:uncharacterized protein LOC124168305 isoform X2 [Ischnura elegans]
MKRKETSEAVPICRIYSTVKNSPLMSKIFLSQGKSPRTSLFLVQDSRLSSPLANYLQHHRRRCHISVRYNMQRCRVSFTKALGADAAHLLLCLLLTLLLLGGGADGAGTSTDRSPEENGEGSPSSEITCYTCVNVSSNDECNRFAIDRPCPKGGDYCLTLHVMDKERSVLVNKRCASLNDCARDATGCTTNNQGQTQCISCCDEPYCNDFAPSNSTNALFYRSGATGLTTKYKHWDVVLRVFLVLVAAFRAHTLGGTS